MNPEDEQPDDLTRDYRGASAAESGRPSAATRAAILAEARATALRRRPAANDSGIWWRAAASVAVVGVGLLIWRQVDRPMASAANVARVEAPDAGNAVSAEAEADTAADSRAEGAVASAAASAAAEKRESRASVAQAFDVAPSPARQAMARTEAPPVNAADLLQSRFPSEFASSTPPRALWVLQDEAGGVLRSGRLDDNEGFAAVTLRMEPEFPGQRIGPWSVNPVTNTRGVAVQLGVAVVR